jgi:hypothetical protein
MSCVSPCWQTPIAEPLLLNSCCPYRFVEFLVVRYPVQLALGLFIAVGGILMAAFLAYQVCWWERVQDAPTNHMHSQVGAISCASVSPGVFSFVCFPRCSSARLLAIVVAACPSLQVYLVSVGTTTWQQF